MLRATFAWLTFIGPAVGSDFFSSVALANLGDTLVFPNTEGGVDPWLAESWESSEDGLTWTFNVKPGVTFHDGTELLASDVAYSMNRLLAIGEGYAYLFVDTIESATALDDYTVEFKLAAPSGLFVPSLARLYVLNEDLVRANTAAEGPYGDEGDYGKDFLLTHDAGSGPYAVKEFPLEEYLLMEKYSGFWGTFVDNAPDQFRMIATTETATVRTLMADQELEITDQWQTLEALDGIEGVDVAAFPNLTSFCFKINTRIPPTDDIHCRRAMSYAFDYDTAVGLEWAGTTAMVGPVPAALGGHNPGGATNAPSPAPAPTPSSTPSERPSTNGPKSRVVCGAKSRVVCGAKSRVVCGDRTRRHPLTADRLPPPRGPSPQGGKGTDSRESYGAGLSPANLHHAPHSLLVTRFLAS